MRESKVSVAFFLMAVLVVGFVGGGSARGGWYGEGVGGFEEWGGERGNEAASRMVVFEAFMRAC